MGGGETPKTSTKELDILIFGLGWTSQFLVPLLNTSSIPYAGTTTTGRSGSYKFKFSYPENEDESREEHDLDQYRHLPTAKTLLITFPIKGKEAMRFFMDSYRRTHDKKGEGEYQVVLLGSTGIWTIEGQSCWVDRNSRYDTKDGRAEAEDWVIGSEKGCVLNLSGLWGGERDPRHWVDRVAGTKEGLGTKKSLHMIHGEDVSRAIIAVHQNWPSAAGQRWMLTDLMVYDWWELILGFGGELDHQNGNSERAEKQIKWIGELMEEQDVKALPRAPEVLGRCYDTREFWKTFGLMPARARL